MNDQIVSQSFGIDFQEVCAMHFEIFSGHNHHAAKRPLFITMKLYDGSEITVQMEDTLLVFRTAFGDSKIALSNIMRMDNVGNVITLRKLSRANKFQIECLDGCRIIGAPKSPAKLHFFDENMPHGRGEIRMWEIDWLEVVSNNEEPVSSSQSGPVTFAIR